MFDVSFLSEIQAGSAVVAVWQLAVLGLGLSVTIVSAVVANAGTKEGTRFPFSLERVAVWIGFGMIVPLGLALAGILFLESGAPNSVLVSEIEDAYPGVQVDGLLFSSVVAGFESGERVFSVSGQGFEGERGEFILEYDNSGTGELMFYPASSEGSFVVEPVR